VKGQLMMRAGLIVLKLGMSRVLDANGFHIPVTLCKLDVCRVVSVKTKSKDGYTALQLGSGLAKIKNVSKPMRGHFAKLKVEPSKKIIEFRVDDSNILDIGHEFIASHFEEGQ
jgi:large subunit ribosomal protein L3